MYFRRHRNTDRGCGRRKLAMAVMIISAIKTIFNIFVKLACISVDFIKFLLYVLFRLLSDSYQHNLENPSHSGRRNVPSFTPPPGRRLSWKYQSSQSGPTLHWDAARELGWMESMRSCVRVRRTSAIKASSRGCLTRREITLFSPPSLCQPVELWAPRW